MSITNEECKTAAGVPTLYSELLVETRESLGDYPKLRIEIEVTILSRRPIHSVGKELIARGICGVVAENVYLCPPPAKPGEAKTKKEE